MSRVVLAMSGGVDSSVAAHLLQAQGHDVIGVFMRHGERSVRSCSIDGQGHNSPLLPVVQGTAGRKQGCCSAADAADARRVADRLSIPFYALDLQEEFRQIVDYFVHEYGRGRTPNPCIQCNNWIKFGRLFDYADSVGAEYVATGHYARLERDSAGDVALRRGIDSSKDQSYVLFGIQRVRLERMLLPVGGYRKAAIRQMAERLGLDVAAKPDSQEICFVTAGHHGEFVRQRLNGGAGSSDQPGSNTGAGEAGGEIVTTAGQVVGRHSGVEHFTVGQRRGLGVALGEPYFVVRIEPSRRRVVIGRREELAQRRLTASGISWLVDPPSRPFACLAQIRYRSGAQPAWAVPLDERRLAVDFQSPQLGIAPGQAVVLYDDDRVLGGGWIDSRPPDEPPLVESTVVASPLARTSLAQTPLSGGTAGAGFHRR